MSPDTVALCFGVFDRVLNVLKVRTRLVRVLAAACLSLTAKYTEDEARESFARSLCTVTAPSPPPSFQPLFSGSRIYLFAQRSSPNGTARLYKARLANQPVDFDRFLVRFHGHSRKWT